MKKNLVFTLMLTLLTVGSSHAALFTFSDLASFQTATSGLSLNTLNFDSLTALDVIADGSSVDGIKLSNSSGLDIIIDNEFSTTSPANYLGLDDGITNAFMMGDNLKMNFIGTAQAIGLYVIVDPFYSFGSQAFTLMAGGAFATINPADVVNLSDSNAYFLGIYQDDPSQAFSYAQLYSVISNGVFFNVDDITTDTPVPLPGSILLLGSALTGFFFRRRRK